MASDISNSKALQHDLGLVQSCHSVAAQAAVKAPPHARCIRQVESFVSLLAPAYWHATHHYPFRVLSSTTPWQPVMSPTQVRSGVRVTVRGSRDVFLVLATDMGTAVPGVYVAAMWHAPSKVLLVATSGLQSPSVSVSMNTLLNTSTLPVACVFPHANLPPSTRVHAGLFTMGHNMWRSPTWRLVARVACHRAQHLAAPELVVVAGFSMGGAMSHLCSMALWNELRRCQEPTRMLVMAFGAPRTGNNDWSLAFARQGPQFAHVGFVTASAALDGDDATDSSRTLAVDEVVTLPLHFPRDAGAALVACRPQVIVAADGGMLSCDKLLRKNAWSSASTPQLLISLLKARGGFSKQHRMPLPAIHSRVRKE